VTEQDTVERGAPEEAIKAIPVRHPMRWVAAFFILVLAGMFIHMLATTPNISWSDVWFYVRNQAITDGLKRTLEVTAAAMVIGVVGGVLIAVMRLSQNPVVSGSAWTYIWFFRGTPVLVQLIFWYNLAALIPSFSLGVPFGIELGNLTGQHWLGHQFLHTHTNDVVYKYNAVVLGFGLNEAAYMSEIVRGGILSVEYGQTEAALALGMSRLQTMRRIVLPQTMRVIVPPIGNETISMLKTTSIAAVVSYPELATVADQIGNRSGTVITMMVVASLWYLVVTTVLTTVQYYVERYFARGSTHQLPLTPRQRFLALFRKQARFHPGVAPAPAAEKEGGR
jgi:polar amino acid transport system permease protein